MVDVLEIRCERFYGRLRELPVDQSFEDLVGFVWKGDLGLRDMVRQYRDSPVSHLIVGSIYDGVLEAINLFGF